MHINGPSHEENRARICAVCWQKASRLVSPRLESAIWNYTLPTFHLSNPSLPTVTCASCSTALHSEETGDLRRSLRLVQLTEEKLKQPLRKLNHRSCQIYDDNFRQCMRSKPKSRKPKPKALQLCPECLTELYPGE